MELKTYPVAQIHTNPWQKRKPAFVGAEWDAFVEDIRVNGVRQPPPARVHPDDPTAVQLQDGERRFTAWTLTHPGEPFAVVVETISDKEMFEHGVRLNVQRRAFNDIELADIAADYIAEFGATQTEAAQLIGYKTGAGVSNLIKLRKLPASIQQYVVDGNLSDAHARALVGVVSLNPKAAQTIADKVAAAPKSEKADVFEQNARSLYWSKMEDLDNADWADDWLADAPLTVERDLGDGDHVLPACAGCVFNVNDHCARKACFEEKTNLWAQMETARIAALKKIAAAGSDENVTVLFKGDYHDDDNAKRLLNAPKEVRSVLRLAPYTSHQHNYLRNVFGTGAVTLVTTDRAAVDAYLADTRKSSNGNGKLAKAEKPAEETEAERSKRVAAEKKELAAARAARASAWKSKYDALWLVENASKIAGAQLVVEGDFLKFAEALFEKEYRMNGDVMMHFSADLEAKIEAGGKDADTWRRIHIVMCVFGDYGIADSSGKPDYTRAREHILKAASFQPAGKNRWGGHEIAHGFGVTLPKGWDIPPVHKTPINCWQCGTFAGNVSEKLTQRDINEDGWVDDGKAGVFCSHDHKMEYFAAHVAQPVAKKGKQNAAPKTKSAAKKKAKTPKRRR